MTGRVASLWRHDFLQSLAGLSIASNTHKGHVKAILMQPKGGR